MQTKVALQSDVHIFFLPYYLFVFTSFKVEMFIKHLRVSAQKCKSNPT